MVYYLIKEITDSLSGQFFVKGQGYTRVTFPDSPGFKEVRVVSREGNEGSVRMTRSEID